MCFFQTYDYNKSLLLCDHSPPLLIIEFLKHLNKEKGKLFPSSLHSFPPVSFTLLFLQTSKHIVQVLARVKGNY